MAYLNAQQRESLRNELKGMNVNRVRGKVRRLDPKSRLVYIRNVQTVGVHRTRYDLPTLGVRVILIEHEYETIDETDNPGSSPVLYKRQFEPVDILVEPLPENTL